MIKLGLVFTEKMKVDGTIPRIFLYYLFSGQSDSKDNIPGQGKENREICQCVGNMARYIKCHKTIGWVFFFKFPTIVFEKC